MASKELIRARSLVDQGDYRKALRALERARKVAYGAARVDELHEVIRLASFVNERGLLRRTSDDVIYAAEQNIRHIERARGGQPSAVPTEPAAPVVAAAQPLAGQLGRLQRAFLLIGRDLSRLTPEDTELPERLAESETQLKLLGRTLVELRISAEDERAAARRAHEEARRAPEPAAPAAPATPYLPPPAAPLPPARTLGDALGGLVRTGRTAQRLGSRIWAQLEDLGPHVFALVGGLVTLLGLVFLSIFLSTLGGAGFLTPELRVALGGVASAGFVATGIWIQRRFGRLQVALAAVGVGVAGAYGTILAGAALSDVLPVAAALAAAVVVAVVGALVAVRWSSELLGGLALVGGMLLPLVAIVQSGPSTLATWFVALLAAASGVLGIRERWPWVLRTAVAASAPQVIALVADTGPHDSGRFGVFAVAIVFSCIYTAGGIAYQLARAPHSLPVSAALVLPSAALASWAASRVVSGIEYRGLAVLLVAAAYGGVAAAFLVPRRQRDLGAVLAVAAVSVAAFAISDLVSDAPLVGIWAAQAPLLAWLVRRLREQRLLVLAFSYLGLAAGHAFIYEAPPHDLFVRTDHPALGSEAAAFVSAAALALLWLTRELDVRDRFDALIARAMPAFRLVLAFGGALLGVYVSSLVVLEIGTALGSFAWGEVALTGWWSLLAAAAVALPRWPGPVAFAAFLAVLAKAVAYDLVQLDEDQWASSFVVVAVLSLFFGHLAQRPLGARLAVAAGAATTISVALAVPAVVTVADVEWEGAALLAVAAGYAVAAGIAFIERLRDHASALAAVTLGLACAGCAELLSGLPLVAAAAGGSVGVSLLGRRLGESRAQLAATVVLALGVGYALSVEAPPRDLFVRIDHPAGGAPAIALAAAASLALAWLVAIRALRAGLAVAGGLLAMYAGSLVVLEVAAAAGSFEWGEVALTIWWAGSALLAVLLRRYGPEAMAGGLVLALAKAVTYDLVELDDSHWACSFLALAAAWLAAAYVAQRARGARLAGETAAATALSAALAVIAVAAVTEGDWWAAGLLALGGGYAAVAAVVFAARLRDFASLCGGLGLALAAAGCAQLIDGFPLVAIGAGAAVALALLARFVREPRALLAGGAFFALAAGYAFAVEAQPRDLFVRTDHPGIGAGALAVVAGAAAALAWLAIPGQPQDRLDALLARVARPLRATLAAIVGLLALYAGSLVILEVAIAVGSFDWGEVAVTLLWTGTAALAIAPRRRARALGFALLVLTWAKAVAYDGVELVEAQWTCSFLVIAVVCGVLAHLEQRARGNRFAFEPLLVLAASVAFSSSAVVALADGDVEPLGLLALAGGYGVAAVAAFADRLRDYGTAVGAVALGLGAVTCADLLSGLPLVAAAAAGSVAIAATGARLREPRAQLASASLLAVGLGYALAEEAPPRDLFVRTDHPALGGAAIALVAVAFVALSRLFVVSQTRDRLDTWLAAGAQRFRTSLVGTAVLLALYAVLLLVLELAIAFGSFGWGEVAVTVLSAVLALVLTRGSRARPAGLGVLVLAPALTKTIAYDLPQLSDAQWGCSFFVLAGTCLAVAHVTQRRVGPALAAEPLAAVAVSIGLSVSAVASLADGDALFLGLLALAGAYALAAARAAVDGLRDPASVLGAVAITLAAGGCAGLLSGVALVTAGAAGSLILAFAGARLAEPRTQLPAALLLALAVGYALATEAPIKDLFLRTDHPGVGAGAIGIVAAACLAFARVTFGAGSGDRLDAWLERVRHSSSAALTWFGGALGVYAMSLLILEAALAVGGGSQGSFERGEAAVSGSWALVALVFLRLGLTRARAFVAVGFLLFIVSLAKIFLFDLTSLSLIARALSFLAVGAVLLVAGFFYQRLSHRGDETLPSGNDAGA
jgi:hypothetical protein